MQNSATAKVGHMLISCDHNVRASQLQSRVYPQGETLGKPLTYEKYDQMLGPADNLR